MLKIKNAAAAIPAQDIKRARQFYEQKLGLKPAEEEPDGGVMDHPEFKTHEGLVDMPDGTKGAWFKDTEGNLIALTQRVPAVTRSN